jgi:hypothetical protein
MDAAEGWKMRAGFSESEAQARGNDNHKNDRKEPANRLS